MKAPPKRKGNQGAGRESTTLFVALNESPSEKEGKFVQIQMVSFDAVPLNESPSEKEGKSHPSTGHGHRQHPQ